MAPMSFTEARIALEQFVKANQAAVRLGEALEAAINLEKRSAELLANVDYLQKEEKSRQTNLDAMEKEEKERTALYKKNYDAAMNKQAADTQAAREKIEAEKRDAAARKQQEDGGYAASVRTHQVAMANLEQERQRALAEIAALTKQADDIKERMRKFVS
jgi:hypothetical protein